MGWPAAVVVVPLGTLGDVDPALWVAHELRRSGELEVAVVVEASMAPALAPWGLDAAATVDSPIGRAVAANPALVDPVAAIELLHEWYWDMTVRTAPIVAELLQRSDASVVAAPPFATGAYVAACAEGAAFVKLCVAPSNFATGDVRSTVSPAEQEAGRRATASLRGRIEDLVGFRAPRQRAELALFPPWFTREPIPTEASRRYTGFIAPPAHSPPPGVRDFSSVGASPVLGVTFGSATTYVEARVDAVVSAVRALGWRAVVFASGDDHTEGDVLRTSARASVPLLRHCAGIVHAASMGVSSVALQAAVPQLVWPMTSDQPYTAAVLRHLGVATTVPETCDREDLPALLEPLVGPLGRARRARSEALVARADTSTPRAAIGLVRELVTD